MKKPATCMYCGSRRVLEVIEALAGTFKCEDCLAVWVEYKCPGESLNRKLLKAGTP